MIDIDRDPFIVTDTRDTRIHGTMFDPFPCIQCLPCISGDGEGFQA